MQDTKLCPYNQKQNYNFMYFLDTKKTMVMCLDKNTRK
jgi:hypothetical protein